MKPILYFGNDWSAENRTSSHHIAMRLADRYDVFYIECPGMRSPIGSGRDLRKIVQKLARFLRGPRKVRPGLKVLTLVQIPFHRFAFVRRLNAWLIWRLVRAFMWLNGVRHPIAWFVAPHVASLIGCLDESLSVYFCTDDHASMPGMDVEAIAAMDDRLTSNADLVFVASDTLLEKKRNLNPNTYHSPHGVDVEHFGRARQGEGPLPEDIRRLPRPIVGYFGLVESYTDFDLLAYLARQRPQWTFLMIGRIVVPEADLPRLPNLHFIGRRPYEQLPDYGRWFSASIIPHKLLPNVLHMNPLKLREYLAMGKPIVSVCTPETEKFSDVIELARNPEEFLAKLDRVVAQPQSKEEEEGRISRVASASWEARVEQLVAHVESALARKTRESTSVGAIARVS